MNGNLFAAICVLFARKLPAIDLKEYLRFFIAVSCIDDQFQYGNYPICQSLSEYEPLVFGKVIHVAQHPLGEIVPFHKDYRWVATTCHCFPMSKVQRFKYLTKSDE